MPQSLAALYVHIIFSTKDRAASITPELQPRLYEFCGGILRSKGRMLTAAGGTADHVHFVVSLSRELAVAETVRLLKANSSKWIHETFPMQQSFRWQAGYGAFSVSFSNLAKVKSIHREPGGTSSDAEFSGGVSRVPATASGCV